MRTVLFLISWLWLVPAYVQAQDLTNLAIDGLVKDDEGGRLTGATVVLYQDGIEMSNQTSERNGRFEFILEFGHEFTIRVKKSGFVDKIIFVNTKGVPEDEQAWGYEWPITVEMFKRIPGVDYSLLDQPIGKIYYEPRVENFVNDNAYARQIKDDIKKLEDAQKEAIKAEEDRLKRIEEDFELAIRDAENAINDGDYLMAKDNLLAAKSMKPESTIPTNLLAQVEQKLSEEGAQEDKYLSALSTADQAFGNGDYQKAIESYGQALEIKPGESYPKQRQDKSKELLAKERAAEDAANQVAAKERQYNEAISKADAAFSAGSYRDAKTYYQNALTLKDDAYPKDRIVLADQKLLELAQKDKRSQEQAKIDAAYAEKIDKADAAFSGSNFENAKALYDEALKLKPEEAYPKTQLQAIEEKLNALALKENQAEEQRKKDEAYTKLIASAEKNFQQNNLAAAKADFTAASEIKPNERFPIEQIDKINIELAKLSKLEAEKAALAEKQREYDAAVKEGDELYASQSLIEARTKYQEATRLKPEETYPKSQLKIIEEELIKQDKQESINQAYQELIADAEKRYAELDLRGALNKYKSAADMKPQEPQPSKRIAAITKELEEKERLAQQEAEQEEKMRLFETLVKDGDAAFEQKQYSLALKKYEEALKLKTDEYTNAQIVLVRKAMNAKEDDSNRLAIEMERKRKYASAIEKARLEVNSGSYSKANETLNLAGTFAKEETDHIEMREEIEQLIARKEEQDRIAKEEEAERQRLAKLREEYNNLMRLGNEAMTSSQYEKARESFNGALELFPEESLPKAKLESIDKLEAEAERQRVQIEFNGLVSTADRLFIEESYESALEKYNDAMELNNNSSHVQERIQRIKKIIAEKNKGVDVEASESHRRVVEETYDEGRTKVTIRRVTFNGKEQVYKRVVHSWGGRYYFLDDQPITELVWNRETAK